MQSKLVCVMMGANLTISKDSRYVITPGFKRDLSEVHFPDISYIIASLLKNDCFY